MSNKPQSRSYNWQKLQSDEQCNRHVSMYQNKFIRHYFINDRLRNPFLACSKHDQSSFGKYHKSASKPKHTSPKTAPSHLAPNCRTWSLSTSTISWRSSTSLSMSFAGTVKVAREGGMGKRRLHASPNSFQMDELSGFMLAALFRDTA